MLALAFLTIAAATEHTTPSPDDQIPITRNEIAALFSALAHRTSPTVPGTGCDGRPGAAVTSTAPKPATTSGKPANHERHEVRLEY